MPFRKKCGGATDVLVRFSGSREEKPSARDLHKKTKTEEQVIHKKKKSCDFQRLQDVHRSSPRGGVSGSCRKERRPRKVRNRPLPSRYKGDDFRAGRSAGDEPPRAGAEKQHTEGTRVPASASCGTMSTRESPVGIRCNDPDRRARI